MLLPVLRRNVERVVYRLKLTRCLVRIWILVQVVPQTYHQFLVSLPHQPSIKFSVSTRWIGSVEYKFLSMRITTHICFVKSILPSGPSMRPHFCV